MKVLTDSNKIITNLLIYSCIWIIIEGIFRKWVLPEFSSELFAIKYGLFALTYSLHYLTFPSPFNKVKHPFQIFLFLFILWCTYLYFFYDPLNSPWLVKIMGVINYLFFMPLISIIPTYLVGIGKIERIIMFLIKLSLPILILGIIQYYLPTDHILNSLVNEEQKVTRVEGFTRSLSIFTFVKVYNVYLLFTIPLFFCYLFYRFYYGGRTLLLSSIVVLGVLNLVMTASRLPTFLTFSFFVLSLLYLFVVMVKFRGFILFILFSTTIIGIFLINNVKAFEDSTIAFIARAEHQEALGEKGYEGYSAEKRLLERLNIYKYSKEAGMLGFGIGTTYQGTGFFLSNKRPDIPYEEEGERVVLEIGVIGATLLLLLRLSILLFSINLLVRIKRLKHILFLLPLVLYLIPQTFFINNLTFNYLDNFSYWFCFGLILVIKKDYELNLSEI